MLIENKGIKTDTFYIPPFILNEGEIVVLHLSNRPISWEERILIIDILCGNTIHKNVVVHKKLTYVPHFLEPNWRHFFYPVTVGEYLRKHANLDSPFASKIYEIEWMHKRIKFKTLAGNPRRLLCLYSTLSKTANIVFDVVGQDSQGAEQSYQTVKEVVNKGGAAILLDSFGDMKNDCTKYIEVQWIKSLPDTIAVLPKLRRSS